MQVGKIWLTRGATEATLPKWLNLTKMHTEIWDPRSRVVIYHTHSLSDMAVAELK